MKIALLLSVFFFSKVCLSQNLVLNGGFEQYSICPDNTAQIFSALFWGTPSTNNYATSGTPDYFNECAGNFIVGVPINYWGYQPTHSGQAYAGLDLFYLSSPNFREYIEGQFKYPLKADTCYRFECYLNKDSWGKYATDDISVYFSDSLVQGIDNFAPLPFVPQIDNTTGNFITDTLNWQIFAANYHAHGGEKYFIIGNYKNDANTSTTLTANTKVDEGYIYIDDVSLIQIPSCTTGLQLQSGYTQVKIFPNPVTDVLGVKIENNEPSVIILYDVFFRKILKLEFTNETVINLNYIPNGIYIYELLNKTTTLKTGKITKL